MTDQQPDNILHRLALRERVTQFLAHEAMLLDEGRFEEWYDSLDDDLDYRIPLRLAAETRAEEFLPDAFLLKDTKEMIRIRIDRLNTGQAHAEAPPSRTVRSVSSICIIDSSPTHVDVSSALVLFRHRGTEPEPDIFYARREDRLRLQGDATTLLSRTIKMAHSLIEAPNIAVFL